MRFCPFCSAENADESAVCASCGRRLPPLPPRRAGSKGQPTGVILPPRPASPGPPPTPVRKTPTLPPPLPSANVASTMPPPGDSTLVNPSRDSAPALPPPPVDDQWSDTAAELRNALDPSPAALRREAPAFEPPGSGPTRRKSDSKAPPIPVVDRGSAGARTAGSGPNAAPSRSGSGSIPQALVDRAGSPNDTSYERAKSPSQPPPFTRPASQPPPPFERSKSPSQPPPFDRAKSPSRPPPRPLDNFGGETEIDPRAGMHAEDSAVQRAPWAPQLPPPSTLAAQSQSLNITSSRLRAADGMEPPPTRIHRPNELVDRPFTPQKVNPIPEIPEPGLINAARYAYQFALARWQRSGARKTLAVEIKQDTEALDQVLGALGRAARGAKVEGRVFSAENAAITAAEERVASLQKESGDVEGRKAEENSKFVDVERERNEKLVEAERMVEEAQRELQHLEAQRRALRDKRKELERRQKAFLKNADDHDRQAGSAPLGDQRQELRRAAEGHRKEAAALEPDKQEIDRRITALERPISEATARLDAAKAELDASKRSLNDAREGHTHRLAELDAEQKRKAREVSLAEAEIQRRLVTLGTLVNLNRIEDPQFAELYQRIDRLRGAITARTTEIEKLTAEREAYDRGTLVRGVATIGGAFVALIALIVILRAVL
ncbi:MAG TPA: hypothetical protein VIV40_34290 [Kofleriaceae bacterium]